MSEDRIGVFLPYQKRIIHAVKELNFDLEILKNDPNDDYYAIIRSFYNGANHEWRSSTFETIKECQEWAKDKLREDGWQVEYIIRG